MENLLAPPLVYFLIMWSAVTLLWVALLVYRGVMENREEDQLFITGGHEQMAAEQSLLNDKVTRLGKPIWALGIASVVLLVATIGIWMWIGMQQSGR